MTDATSPLLSKLGVRSRLSEADAHKRSARIYCEAHGIALAKHHQPTLAPWEETKDSKHRYAHDRSQARRKSADIPKAHRRTYCHRDVTAQPVCAHAPPLESGMQSVFNADDDLVSLKIAYGTTLRRSTLEAVTA